MAALPSYVTVLFPGYGEEFDPSVHTVEMERGAPKSAVINSQVLMKVSATLYFRAAADVASFETWYFDTIGRVGTFTMTHPRTGATITAWFEGGRIGRLVPLVPDFSQCQRECVIEYLR